MRPLISLMFGTVLLASAVQVQAQQSVRPEVGQPLQQAQTHLQAKKYREALASANEAAKVSGLTAYERYLVDRVRAAAAGAAGNHTEALQAYRSALSSPEFPASEKATTLDAVARLSFAAKRYADAATAVQEYQAAGGTNAATLALLPQTLYLAGNYPEAAKVLKAQVATAERAGKAPSEAQLQLLSNVALKQNDNAGYIQALEKLATYHSKPNYWLDLIVRTTNKQGFSDRLTLDAYRLRSKTGTLDKVGDYMEAVQLALQAGLPGEAEQFLKTGYDRKLLGTGAAGEVDRHKRLSDLVARRKAEDRQGLAEAEKQAQAQESGDDLVLVGLKYVGYKEYDRGLPLIEQGIAKGNLKQPEQAKLHLGYAYLEAGRKADATKTLRTVKGTSGEADIARLWLIRAR